MAFEAFVIGMTGGTVAGLAGIVYELRYYRKEVIADAKDFTVASIASVACQAVIAGLVAFFFADDALSYFLTGLTSLGLVAYLLNMAFVEDKSRER